MAGKRNKKKIEKTHLNYDRRFCERSHEMHWFKTQTRHADNCSVMIIPGANLL